MKQKTLLMVFVISALVFAMVFIGCSKKAEDPEKNKSGAVSVQGEWYAKYPEPVTVKIGRRTSKNYLPGEDCSNNQYTKWIKEKLNINIEMAFSQENVTQEITLALATGKLPDVMIITDPLQLQQLIDADLLADLNGVYDKYASSLLKDMVSSYGGKEKAFAPALRDGKLYAMSGLMAGYVGAMTWIRKDWLDKLNLPMPTTMEELVETARKFVAADLAGGKQTIGIELSKDLAALYGGLCTADPVFNYYGAYPKLWVQDEQGQWQWGSTMLETKQTLSVLHDWYKAGIIAKDFVTRDVNASIASGYCGIVFAPWWVPIAPLNDTRANNSEADWCSGFCTIAPDGKYRVFAHNINVAYAIVNKDYAHPEALIKLLNLSAEVQVDFDGKALSDEEIKKYDLQIPEEVLHAYAGTNMKWNDWPTSTILRFYNQMIKLGAERAKMYQNYKAGNKEGIPGIEQKLLQNVINFENASDRTIPAWQDYTRYKAMEEMVKFAPQFDSRKCYYPITTATMQQKWANLKALEEQMFLKIIMGEAPLNSFDKFVTDWQNQGGKEITVEVNEQAKGRN